jgi:integrase
MDGHRSRCRPPNPHHQWDDQDRAREGNLPEAHAQIGRKRPDCRAPDFAVAVLCRRQEAVIDSQHGGVFLTRNGTWHQVTNVERRWRQIRQDTGLDCLTPHTFRKTVVTLDSERVDAETASQQLGHSSPAITREFYISKPAIAADVAHVLEALARPEVGSAAVPPRINGE